jgi:hypothetical protein
LPELPPPTLPAPKHPLRPTRHLMPVVASVAKIKLTSTVSKALLHLTASAGTQLPFNPDDSDAARTAYFRHIMPALLLDDVTTPEDNLDEAARNFLTMLGRGLALGEEAGIIWAT